MYIKRKRRQERILYRIIFPFLTLFTVMLVLLWFFSSFFLSSFIEEALRDRMKQVANIISQSPFVLNAEILQQIKKILAAEIVLQNYDGKVLVATMNITVADLAIPDRSGMNIDFGSNTAKEQFYEGERFKVFTYPLAIPGFERTLLSFWTPADQLQQIRWKIFQVIGYTALLGWLAVVVIAYLIARSITAPIEDLAQVTREVADGKVDRKARIARHDEIGLLADSFNQMIGKLAAYEKKLVESEKMATAGQMAGGLAHEIRNPLTSIKMLAQVLHGRLQGSKESQSVLHSLIAEIDRLDHIIQAIIDRSRSRELQLEEQQVNAIIEDVAALIGPNLAANRINLQLECGHDLQRVYADGEKLKQVLWNLMLNAKEAMPKGGRLHIRTRNAGDKVEVVLEDSGTGIPEEIEQLVWAPTFTTKPEGMGLGLTISEAIIKQHGGKLKLENRAEGGLRVTIMLPAMGAATERGGVENA